MSEEDSVKSPRETDKNVNQFESSRPEGSSEEDDGLRPQIHETASRAQTSNSTTQETESKTNEEESMEVDDDPETKSGPSVANEMEIDTTNNFEENLSDIADFEVVNRSDCGSPTITYDADILFNEPEPDERFLVEKRLPKEMHSKELRDACFLYANSKNKSVSKSAKMAVSCYSLTQPALVRSFQFKMQLSTIAKFPRLELPSKTSKPRRWVKRTHIRHDKMQRTIWEREVEKFVNNPAIIHRNEEHKSILTLTDEEYNTYFQRLDVEQIPTSDDAAVLDDPKAWPRVIAESKRPWTLDESRYLVRMYQKLTTRFVCYPSDFSCMTPLHHFRWPVIADQYNFNGLQRSVFEIKSRFFFIFDLMCFVRDKRHFMSDFDSDDEFLNRKRLKADLNIHPDIHKQIAQLENELMNTSPSELEPPPRIPTVVEINPAPVQKSLTTARSSSSVPPSRMPSVPKSTARINLEQSIDYEKKIEAALDTSVLRFFNNQTAGPHLRSQEFKLVSNVNPKKRANIENVIETLGLCKFSHERLHDLCPKRMDGILICSTNFSKLRFH